MVRRAAAIFGLERVLLPRGPGRTFSRALRAAGLTPPISLALAPVRGWPVDAVAEAAERAADELAGRLPPHAPVEIAEQRAAGRQLVIVTAQPKPLVEPLAARWGFDDVIATSWAAAGDVYTGLDGAVVAGPARLAAVRRWADAHDVALDESHVYGGSLDDVGLLAAAEHRRVVNPDPGLAAVAAARRWPIRWFDAPSGVVKVAGRELQEWLRPFADERLVANAQIEISGIEHIPRRGAAIVAFNHRSYFDAMVVPILVAKAGRSARGIGKKEVFDAPLIGPFVHAFGGIRVDRGTGSDEPLHRAERALRAGELIVIAPEGTIPRGPAFFEPELRGRWGTARLAHATKAPVIPVGLWGTEHVWPRNQRLPTMRFRDGAPVVSVQIGAPVALAYDDVDADTRRIMGAIVAQLPAEARVRRTPSEDELRRTYPPNYRGDPTREVHRRPGRDR